MKRLSFFLAILLILSFASCGEDLQNEDAESANGESSVGSQLVIGYEDNFGYSENGDDIYFDISFDFSDESDKSPEFDHSNEDNESSIGDESSNAETSSDVSDPDVSEPETSDDEDENSKDEEDASCKHKNQSTVDQKTATCSESGYSGDKVCSDCGTVVKKGSVIQKTDHPSFEIKNKKEATLKSEGYSGDKVCTVCKTVAVSGEVVAKLTYDDVILPSVLKQIEDGFIRLVNEERLSLGLSALTVDPYLDSCAQLRAEEIKVSFSHTRPNGESCFSIIDSSKYSWTNLGENIGYTSHVANEYFYPDEEYFTPTDEVITKVYTKMFQAFKASSGHYANMISPEYKHMGLGVTYAESNYEGIPNFYFAHFFGNS